jgi:hypothetical protein
MALRLLRLARPFLLVLSALFVSPGLLAQTTASQSAGDQAIEESCKKFVQAFYDWYLSKEAASGKLSTPSMDAVLKHKADALSPELYRRLKEDRDAEEKCKGEICGLDFDPFLNSQDPSAHFSAVNVTRKGSSYWVDVYGIESGKRREHVIPELIHQNGQWIFVNFHYGKNKWTDDSNLLSILKELQADREKNP